MRVVFGWAFKDSGWFYSLPLIACEDHVEGTNAFVSRFYEVNEEVYKVCYEIWS